MALFVIPTHNGGLLFINCVGDKVHLIDDINLQLKTLSPKKRMIDESNTNHSNQHDAQERDEIFVDDVNNNNNFVTMKNDLYNTTLDSLKTDKGILLMDLKKGI